MFLILFVLCCPKKIEKKTTKHAKKSARVYTYTHHTLTRNADFFCTQVANVCVCLRSCNHIKHKMFGGPYRNRGRGAEEYGQALDIVSNANGNAEKMKEGRLLLEIAVELGFTEAIYTMGHFYFNGSFGTKMDKKLAASYYERALMTTGDRENDRNRFVRCRPPTQLRLGEMYQRGEYVEKDILKALKYNLEAYDEGNTDKRYLIQFFKTTISRETEYMT